MVNPFKDVNWKPDTGERKKFALSWMMGFPVIAGILLVVRWVNSGNSHWEMSAWIAGTGLGAGTILWLVPVIARPFYVVWYAIACSIGIIVSNLALGILYYFLITPIGLAMRLFGRKPLGLGIDRQSRTHWQDVDPIKDTERYYKQF